MDIEAGSKIDGYILEEEIGTGATGKVWKATDGSKTVALKIMRESLLTGSSSDKHMERWLREINALKRLKHPNIPDLYDFNLEANPPYLAMQYIGSESYDKLIQGTLSLSKLPLEKRKIFSIPLNKRVENISQLAMALWTAHQAEIIHRDIKPANIAGTDVPFLLDFSIAFDTENLEHTRMNVGTALYMPWDGIPNKQGDIYSFGLVAYEILFGQHAIYVPEETITSDRHAGYLASIRVHEGTWRRPTKVPAQELPPDLRHANLQPLEQVFGHVLGDQENRYHDPRDFALELRQAVRQQVTETAPVAVTPEPVPYKAHTGITTVEAYKTGLEEPVNLDIAEQVTQLEAEPGRRHWPRLVAVAVAVLLIVPLMIVILGNQSPATGEAADASATPEAAVVLAETASPTAGVVAAVSTASETPTEAASQPSPTTAATIRPSLTTTPVPSDTAVPSTTPAPTRTAKPTEVAMVQPTVTSTQTDVPEMLPTTALPSQPTVTLALPGGSDQAVTLASDLEQLRTATAFVENYDCVTFNQVYEHVSSMRSAANTDYAIYSDMLVGRNSQMTHLYENFCQSNSDRHALLPMQFEDEHDQLFILIIDILHELES